MIKGLAITPPVLGRISIGRVIEKNNKRLPEKDDQFTITTQIQTREGWINHPLDKELRDKADHQKLRTIPVTLLFDDPELNFRAEYTAFDRITGRLVCAGDGTHCRRHTNNGIEQLPCPTPSHCPLASDGRCKPYGRLNVVIGGDDSLGTFIFRTTGFNSIRTLMARLAYYHAISGGLLAGMPLELKLRGKSTTQSHRAPIYYVDIGIREGLTIEDAIAETRALRERRIQSGFNQPALDTAARAGLGNALFEEDAEETPALLDEFYPEELTATRNTVATISLADKLQQKAITTTMAAQSANGKAASQSTPANPA